MQSEIPAQENKMGVMPINKLLLSMSLPIMISMLVQALYNVVDSVFVARVSEAALTAVSLAFPIQNLMIAFATGTGVASTRCSRVAGARTSTAQPRGQQTAFRHDADLGALHPGSGSSARGSSCSGRRTSRRSWPMARTTCAWFRS